MDLSKVKLIVSDMDGTLLNSHEEPSNLFFEQFKKLKELGVHFIAASGRQFDSIAHKLSPIKDEITIIGENGGVAKRNGELLHLQTMDRRIVSEVIPTLRKIKDTLIILCGKNSAFVETKDQKLINIFKEYYNTYEIVEDLTQVVDRASTIKIALYHPISSEEYIYPKVKLFEKEILLKISGKNWVDLSSLTCNKGKALKVVQDRMNISSEQTVVFGDYLNDIEMLQCAKYSFAMKNAHSEVKLIAKYETDSNNDLGVEKVIAQIIEAKSK